MRKTTEFENAKITPATVNTSGLMQLTGMGRVTAVRIGEAAKARIQVGRRVVWSVKRVQDYLDKIAAAEAE